MLTHKDQEFLAEIKSTNPDIYEFIQHMIADSKQDIKIACHDICNIISLIFGNFQLLELTTPQLTENPRWGQMNDDLRYLISSMEDISFYRYSDKIVPFHVDTDTFVNETIRPVTKNQAYHTLNFNISNNAPDITFNIDQVKTKFILKSILDNVVDNNAESDINIRINKDRDFICVNISDNTSFVPFDMRDTMFNPFVTDKQRHLGLSLASCYQIMMAHNGSIEYAPNLDTGSIFTLRFPI